MPFDFKGSEVRTVRIDDDVPWFVVPDVCAVLEISNPSQAVKRLDPADVRRSDTLISNEGVPLTDSIGRRRTMTMVNESGLYDLIFESRKPEARAFRRWVTNEVLPSIRQTGAYTTPVTTKAPAEAPWYTMAHPVPRQPETEAWREMIDATARLSQHTQGMDFYLRHMLDAHGIPPEQVSEALTELTEIFEHTEMLYARLRVATSRRCGISSVRWIVPER